MKRIEPDDLKKGMFITVVVGRKYSRVLTSKEGNKYSEVVEDKMLSGKVLRIKAVDLPYIVIEYHVGPNKYVMSIDTRLYVLGLCSTEYVRELAPCFKKVEFIPEQKNNESLWVFDQEVEKK